eukprot:TRINITY_DN868_c0_g1_i27.p1 TRINITY_DN868_c0_g1~~TRINITY_DN868_c0_g1_i27.p1  ORF type:complete len:113 (-),score=1.28 TRINITY_DN868_c0_g1_i27:214-552(-)
MHLTLTWGFYPLLVPVLSDFDSVYHGNCSCFVNMVPPHNINGKMGYSFRCNATTFGEMCHLNITFSSKTSLPLQLVSLSCPPGYQFVNNNCEPCSFSQEMGHKIYFCSMIKL